MNPRDVIDLKLIPAIRECETHLDRLHYAEQKGKRLFPMTTADYLNLSDSNVATLDQMLFRFGKLQDAIGQRLLPAILMAGQEWQDNETFLDKLNRLEKLGTISSVTGWIALRDLRNDAMHEYPEEPEINVANLNKLFAGIPVLERYLKQARGYAEEHFALLLSGNGSGDSSGNCPPAGA